MRFSSINKNVLQLAASNWQMANGAGNLETGKWMLTTGCLQTSAGRKLLNSKPGKVKQPKKLSPNRP